MRLIVLLLILANSGFLAWQLLYPPEHGSAALPPEPAGALRLALVDEPNYPPPVVVAQAEVTNVGVPMLQPTAPAAVEPLPAPEQTVAVAAPPEFAPTPPPATVAPEPVSTPVVAAEATEAAPEVAPAAATDTAADTAPPESVDTPVAATEITETPVETVPVAATDTPPPETAPTVVAAAETATAPEATTDSVLPSFQPESPVPPPFASAALEPAQVQAQAELAQKLSQLSLAGANNAAEPAPVAPLTATAQPVPPPPAQFSLSAASVTPTAPLPASAPLCLRAGPYAAKSEAERDLSQLRQRQIESSLRTETRLHKDSTWLYLPPFASRAAARQVETDLDRLGITDHYLVSNPEFNNAVALGLYRDDAGVERRLAELRAKGYYNVQSQPRYQEEAVYWLDLRLSQNDHQRLATLPEQMPTGRIACEEIAIRAEIP